MCGRESLPFICTAADLCEKLWEMEIDYFLPYLQQTTEGLIALLGQAATLPGKKLVNDTIGVVIERADDKV